MPSIVEVPIEVFIDHLFPILPIGDLLHLGATSKFFYLLSSDETFWKRKLEEEFNFPSTETARTTGWKFLYRRLVNPKIFVWGEGSSGRLGMPANLLPKTILGHAVPFPVPLRIPGSRIVNLVAGGMSFHALDSQGRVYVWGALDGTMGSLRSDGYSEPCKRAERPLRLALPCAIRSISCARLFSAALDCENTVWTFTSWGRPFRLDCPSVDKSSPDTTPVQVECGWSFAAVLTGSGDVLVYWPQHGRIHEELHRVNTALDEESPASKAQVSSDEPDVIPCHTWKLEGFDPVRLPAIPNDLPQLPGAQASIGEGLRVVKIAAMDNNIIALTNRGHVLKYDMLTGEDEYRQGRWEYLANFSEVGKISAYPAFADNASPGIPKPKAVQINHISASFKTFFAYSTGEESLVLMGRFETGENRQNQPPLNPIIIPELQYQSVISVVVGDYHYGALTSTGRLLTWGSFSNGALGLGDPLKIEPGKPGGFASKDDLSFASSQHFMRITPPDVRVPAEVNFNHLATKPKQRFCFSVAAAGWHMGALVINTEPGEEGEGDEDIPSEEALDIPGSYPPSDAANRGTGPGRGEGTVHIQPYPLAPTLEQNFGHAAPIMGHRGMLPFRIGFAGRGLPRGRGRGGQDQGAPGS